MRGVVATPWSDAERDQLRRLADNGLSQGQIAQMMGRTKASVHRQFAILGLTPNPPPFPKRPSPGTHPKHAVQRAGAVTLPPLPSLQDAIPCSICGWMVPPSVPHPCLNKTTRLPPLPSLSMRGDGECGP